MHAMKDTESESLSTDYSDLEYDSSENHIDIYSPESIELNGLHHSSLCIRNALYSGLLPSLIKDCTGGTYMCYDSYNHVKAVFKPCDEEPYCIHNPKGLLPDCFLDNNRGINPGTSYLREVIAYFLDYDHFAGVPETTLASIAYHQENDYNMCYKEGSLQVFIPHECSSEDYGSSLYSLEVCVDYSFLFYRMFKELHFWICVCSIWIVMKTISLSVIYQLILEIILFFILHPLFILYPLIMDMPYLVKQHMHYPNGVGYTGSKVKCHLIK